MYQFVVAMVTEGPEHESSLQALPNTWKEASSLTTGKAIIRHEQTLWDQISIIMEQHEDVLCNREDRISNRFLHQPKALRTYFEDALRYNNEKWRLLGWDAISDYFITAHSRHSAEETTGTLGTPPGQDKPERPPKGSPSRWETIYIYIARFMGKM